MVEWNGNRIDVSEVSGLSSEIEVIEYREGSSPSTASIQMPGRKINNNITLRRGIVQSDNDFFEWINAINQNQVERRDLRISLLNEKHEPVVVWKIYKSFPVKIAWTDLKADANETAIESLELAHEGLSIEKLM